MLMMNHKKSTNKSSANRGCDPSERDILCGKDKTYGKHTGNRLFRDRIEEMKVLYCSASSKQEKMAITKEIVRFMITEHGSRFLKKEGDIWIEINNQAARDKVSHALRFAARNLKATPQTSSISSASSKTTPQPNQRIRGQGDDSSDHSLTDNSDATESEMEEPVPYCELFGDNLALKSVPPLSHADVVRQQTPTIETPIYPVHQSKPSRESITREVRQQTPTIETPIHPFHQSKPSLESITRECAMKQLPDPSADRMDVLVDMASHSLGSLHIEDEPVPLDRNRCMVFDTLRSADLDDIVNEHFDDELDGFLKLANS